MGPPVYITVFKSFTTITITTHHYHNPLTVLSDIRLFNFSVEAPEGKTNNIMKEDMVSI